MKLSDFITESKIVEFNGMKLNVSIDGANVDIRAMLGDRQLGYVVFDRDGNTVVPLDLSVDERYQGQGIAKIMYDYVKSLGFRLEASPDQTEAGKGFWQKHRGEERVWEDSESYQPPELNVGDEILKGKFKNSPAKIKGFTKDKHNQPVLKTNKGDVQLFKPRVSKLVSEEMDEPITEAINMTYLEDPIKQTIHSAIIESIGSLYDLKNSYIDLEDMFDEGNTGELNQVLLNKLQGKFLKHGMGNVISRRLQKLFDSELPDSSISLEFKELPDTVNGQATGNDIEINENFTKQLTDKTFENLMTIVHDNYSRGEMTGGLWFVVNSLKRGERDYKKDILDGTERVIAKVTRIIIHEVVHIIQHNRQDDAGRSKYQYRSYLDSKSNEFQHSHVKRTAYLKKQQRRVEYLTDKIESKKEYYSKKYNVPLNDKNFTKLVIDAINKRHSLKSTNVNKTGKLSDTDEGRYHDLYYASPQEIASFSNEIAIKIILDSKVYSARNIEDFVRDVRKIDSETIIDYVRTHLKNRFRAPENKREYDVFKRYVKLTHLALQSWLDKRKEQLSKD